MNNSDRQNREEVSADTHLAITQFTKLLFDFKKKNNQDQIDTLIDLLHRIEAFDDNEEELTHLEIMTVLKTVLSSISKYDPKFPQREANHADIVKECTRLFVRDKLWQKTLEGNKAFAKAFYLDSLIGSNDPEIKKIGEAMGSLMMVKISNLELADIVNEDYSMEKINQALTKYFINSQVKMRTRIDAVETEIDEL